MMVSSRSQRNTRCVESKSKLELRYSKYGPTIKQVLGFLLWLVEDMNNSVHPTG